MQCWLAVLQFFLIEKDEYTKRVDNLQIVGSFLLPSCYKEPLKNIYKNTRLKKGLSS
jgi:hypothetical protein